MTSVHRCGTFLVTSASLVALTGWLLNHADGSPRSVNGNASSAVGDGNCTIDITLQTTPAFAEPLASHYSNYPAFKSDKLVWDTPKSSAELTVNLLTGAQSAGSATVTLSDATLSYTDSNGNTDSIPKVGYVYELNSTSKIDWSGVLDVFPTPNDHFPVECRGGYYPTSLPPLRNGVRSAVDME